MDVYCLEGYANIYLHLIGRRPPHRCRLTHVDIAHTLCAHACLHACMLLILVRQPTASHFIHELIDVHFARDARTSHVIRVCECVWLVANVLLGAAAAAANVL